MLHIVATHLTDAVPDDAVRAANELTQNHDETLVRLEQFRAASTPAQRTRRSRTLRHVAAAGALASVITAAAVGYSRPSSPHASARHAPTNSVGAIALADTEHAAATRNVASDHAVIHDENRSNQHRKTRRPAVRASPSRPASAGPTRVPSTSRAPRINTSNTVRAPAAVGHTGARVTSAASEFGFEG